MSRNCVSTVWIYDRYTWGRYRETFLPPFVCSTSSPVYLLLFTPTARGSEYPKKWLRKRGIRAGIQVKLRRSCRRVPWISVVLLARRLHTCWRRAPWTRVAWEYTHGIYDSADEDTNLLAPTRIALLNACSIANKSFTLMNYLSGKYGCRLMNWLFLKESLNFMQHFSSFTERVIPWTWFSP